MKVKPPKLLTGGDELRKKECGLSLPPPPLPHIRQNTGLLMVTLTVESWSVAGSPRNSLASVGTMSPKFVFLLLTAIQEISAEVGPETSGEAGGVLCTLYSLPCTLYPVLYIVCKLTLQSWKGGLRGDLS